MFVTQSSFAAIRIWRAPRPVRGSAHSFKYSLAYVRNEVCVLRFDNEAGKGDHMHLHGVETAYEFTSPEQLLFVFWAYVNKWEIS